VMQPLQNPPICDSTVLRCPRKWFFTFGGHGIFVQYTEFREISRLFTVKFHGIPRNFFAFSHKEFLIYFMVIPSSHVEIKTLTTYGIPCRRNSVTTLALISGHSLLYRNLVKGTQA
jgi:hypothetical protein